MDERCPVMLSMTLTWLNYRLPPRLLSLSCGLQVARLGASGSITNQLDPTKSTKHGKLLQFVDVNPAKLDVNQQTLLVVMNHDYIIIHYYHY